VVSHEYRDSLETVDPHGLLFDQDDHDHYLASYYERYPTLRAAKGSHSVLQRHRAEQRRRRRQRRGRRVLIVLVALIVAAVGLTGWFVVKPFVTSRLAPDDWSGSGTGTVRVEVHSGEGAAQIGATLAKAGVVRSGRAFIHAAQENADSGLLQPGIYTLRSHMSAASALTLMLDPASRTVLSVSLPEGRTERDTVAKLAGVLGVPTTQVQAAAGDIANLGLPAAYTLPGGGPITSAEGFLFPATYNFDPGSSPTDALQVMIAAFTRADRDAQFSLGAKALGISPYQALIVASMIEREAKFPDDQAKVARVIYNRLAAGDPLKVDASSIYGAIVAGLDPSKQDYSKVNSPYNTYTHKGLPPTPISNPGSAAMSAAIHPAAGKWIYYVNGDAAGHLYFTASDTDFAKAVARCQANHWGCG
jgi:peptidoglycan lytic transglycosylase G